LVTLSEYQKRGLIEKKNEFFFDILENLLKTSKIKVSQDFSEITLQQIICQQIKIIKTSKFL